MQFKVRILLLISVLFVSVGTYGAVYDFTPTDGGKGNFLKLIPQDVAATEPASPSIWTIGEPVPFLYSGTTYPLDGIAYTITPCKNESLKV